MISDRDMPQARTRALMAQILFAQGAFRGAADEARAAAAMGPATDWRVLYASYGYAMPRFNRQLDALKEFVRQNPSSADAHFLLGYQDLVLGQDGPAHAELAIAAVIEPNDVVAKDLLARDGVEIVSSYRPLASSRDAGRTRRHCRPPAAAAKRRKSAAGRHCSASPPSAETEQCEVMLCMLRSSREISRGLSPFSFPENGTVPFRNGEVILRSLLSELHCLRCLGCSPSSRGPLFRLAKSVARASRGNHANHRPPVRSSCRN